MKVKFVIAAALILVLTLALSIPAAYAERCKKAQGHYWGARAGDRFSSKAFFILKNQEELGLSDEQIKKIKDLELKAKKDSIKTDAEIEIIALEINAKMQQETIDTAAINKLIDEKYELMKAKAKSSIAVCAQLKDILTKEQKEKLKNLHQKHRIEKSQ